MDNRERILDWRPEYDEKSRLFRAVANIGDLPLHNRVWRVDSWLDQGREGACVGFGWSHELNASPKVWNVDDAFAYGVFTLARRKYDEWAGEDYDGTSVLAGVKAVLDITGQDGTPAYGSYHWAFSVEEICRTIVHKGPVVLGINWYENMYDPDENHYIHADGPLAGGHCILANGFAYVKKDKTGPNDWLNCDIDRSRVRVHNSWGRDWGFDGNARISIRDLKKLFDDEGGEACIPTYRTV